MFVDFEHHNTNLEAGVLGTLAFFDLYNVPVTAEKVWSLLYKAQGGKGEVLNVLKTLANQRKIFFKDGSYALKNWTGDEQKNREQEISKRQKKVQKFLWLLALLPFVRSMSVINSLSMGACDKDSDIDFFVITAPGFLYFTRTVIIISLRLLGLYKTRTKISGQFCFGFYVSSRYVVLNNILITPEDPYMAFWLASAQPLFGKRYYLKLIDTNQWLFKYLPNFTPTENLYRFISKPKSLYIKPILETILFVPAIILEPWLRKIHINHTFKLPENHWATSTTIANKDMLKLHALDPREKIREDFSARFQVLI